MMELASQIAIKLTQYFKNDVRRINHALKVYSFTKIILEQADLTEEEIIILEITSIIHDIGIKVSEEKYNSSAGKYQELEGPQVANDFLKEFDLNKNIIDKILYLIGNHHTYSKIDSVPFQILVEADFLVNIFEDDMNKKQILEIRNKYFKTKTGITLLENLYL